MINKETPSKSYFRLISSFPLSLVVFIFALQFPAIGHGAVSMEDSALRLVYKKIDSLEQFTIVLAEAMGRELPSTSPISTVSNASVLTLDVMASAIEEKMGRLQYQLLRTRSNFNKVAFRQAILDQKGVGSIDSLNRVLSEMLEISGNIANEHNLSAAHISFTDIDADENVACEVVLLKMLSVLRNVNALLSQPYQPSDVYSEINSSLILWFGAMASTNYKIETTAKNIPYIANKTPADVYQALVVLNKTLSDMLVERGADHLALQFDSKYENIVSSDVYDLSMITFARLTLLVLKIQDSPEVFAFSYPGVKFPSHVYQRVLALHSSLKVYQQIDSNSTGKSR